MSGADDEVSAATRHLSDERAAIAAALRALADEQRETRAEVRDLRGALAGVGLEAASRAATWSAVGDLARHPAGRALGWGLGLVVVLGVARALGVEHLLAELWPGLAGPAP